MRARSIAIVLLALVFAAGAMVLARAWVASQRAVPAAAVKSAPARAVLVVTDALPMGHILKAENLAWQNWPNGTINSGYILQGTKSPADFAGSVLRSAIAKGEPLTQDRVVAPGNRGFLAAVLRPGMRAVSLSVDATSGISGFIFPGDQVDILMTHVLPSEGTPQRKATETIVRDVRVIAIDQKVAGKQEEPAVARNVTVEVTPKQSEILAVATAMGKLSMSLRSVAAGPNETRDENPMPISGRSQQTYTMDSEASRLIGGRGPAAPRVIVLHGASSEDVTFRAPR